MSLHDFLKKAAAELALLNVRDILNEKKHQTKIMNENVAYEDVLLAEDDDDDVYLFKIAFNSVMLTDTIRLAKNGDMLFKELAKKIPDLLFLDIHMPCKNGMDCVREIRQNKLYDAMPVIIFTSEARQEYIENTYRLGANFWMDKPVNTGELARKIQKVLSVDWQKGMIYPSMDQYKI